MDLIQRIFSPRPCNLYHHYRMVDLTVQFCQKWKSVEGKAAPPVPSLRHSLVSLLQATLSITVLAFLDLGVGNTNHADRMFLVASFGASAVLVHSAIASPLAQPRNVIIGHGVSAITGVAVYKVSVCLLSSKKQSLQSMCVAWQNGPCCSTYNVWLPILLLC